MDWQDLKDRQNITSERLFDHKYEQNFSIFLHNHFLVVKALKLSLRDYKESKIFYDETFWERQELIKHRQDLLETNKIDIPLDPPSFISYKNQMATPCQSLILVKNQSKSDVSKNSSTRGSRHKRK